MVLTPSSKRKNAVISISSSGEPFFDALEIPGVAGQVTIWHSLPFTQASRLG